MKTVSFPAKADKKTVVLYQLRKTDVSKYRSKKYKVESPVLPAVHYLGICYGGGGSLLQETSPLMAKDWYPQKLI